MGCKGVCHNYKAEKKSVGFSRYANGQKRCQMCSIFIQWEGLWCPCCGYKLRMTPRSSKFKRKLREESVNRQSVTN